MPIVIHHIASVLHLRISPSADEISTGAQQEIAMTILVAGATGVIGRQVVAQLVRRGADARTLLRDMAKANLPAGVAAVRYDLLDVDSLKMPTGV